MTVQSLSIVVPNRACINQCAFCVSRMHCEDYPDRYHSLPPDVARREYMRRMAFARDMGCATVMLTGTSEPQQNYSFLAEFASMNSELYMPFRCIEFQSTGAFITPDKLRLLRDEIGVTTFSLSLSSFDSVTNQQINGTSQKGAVNIPALCHQIKETGLNLRLSLNMNDAVCDVDILRAAKMLGADQLTLRMLYQDDSDSSQSVWVREHTGRVEAKLNKLLREVCDGASYNDVLPSGLHRIGYNGMSVVLDTDCMARAKPDADRALRYLILRPDCRLYTRWDDKASLVF